MLFNLPFNFLYFLIAASTTPESRASQQSAKTASQTTSSTVRTIIPENEYSMSKVPRGKCLIISNKVFEVDNTRSKTDQGEQLEDRHGTEHDEKNLEQTFKWLQFDVDIVHDCTAKSMKDHIYRYSNMNHSNYQCFVCCILSHGSIERIYGTDGKPIKMEYIRQSFMGNECRSLHGKPKLFLIQACRGGQDDKGQRVRSDTPSCFADSQTSQLLPIDSDFAFVYATTPGKKRHRNYQFCDRPY